MKLADLGAASPRVNAVVAAMPPQRDRPFMGERHAESTSNRGHALRGCPELKEGLDIEKDVADGAFMLALAALRPG